MSNQFFTINPATEEKIAEYRYYTSSEIRTIIEDTHHGWLMWKQTTCQNRSKKLRNLAEVLRKKKNNLAEVITIEMGKPVNQAVGEIEKCAWVCEYYAEQGHRFLEDKYIKTDASESFIHYEPLGTILAIMPWNFPFWQVFRFAAPAIMAGNTALLKHAPNTTACALEIQNLFIEADFPENIFKTILADLPQVEEIIAHPKVQAVTLTGSTEAGRSVASIAGRYLKKTVLELGGNDPYIILDDANLDQAAQLCVQGRLLNTGQSCIAAKRFIVTEKNEKVFTEKVFNILKDKQTGDPLSSTTELGTIARYDLREKLHKQVMKSVENGARCILGGKIPDGKGFFYPVTLLTNVRKGSPAYSEELFGPVAVIICAKDEKESIEIANDTLYGLGSAIFSIDIERAKSIALTQIEAGSCFVNDFVKSDPRVPFGGIKHSGYGRELSMMGIHEFVNAKTISIKSC